MLRVELWLKGVLEEKGGVGYFDGCVYWFDRARDRLVGFIEGKLYLDVCDKSELLG